MTADVKLAYTRPEAAKAVGLSDDTLKKAINAGHLRAKRSGKDADGNPAGKYLITHAALMAWLESLDDA